MLQLQLFVLLTAVHAQLESLCVCLTCSIKFTATIVFNYTRKTSDGQYYDASIFGEICLTWTLKNWHFILLSIWRLLFFDSRCRGLMWMKRETTVSVIPLDKLNAWTLQCYKAWIKQYIVLLFFLWYEYYSGHTSPCSIKAVQYPHSVNCIISLLEWMRIHWLTGRPIGPCSPRIPFGPWKASENISIAFHGKQIRLHFRWIRNVM